MGEVDVRRLLARLTREEFDRWMVAYHELHLDGGFVAGTVAAAVHNGLAPLHWQLGIETELSEPEDHLPEMVYGEQPPVEEDQAGDWERLIDEAARRWGGAGEADEGRLA